jgi:hypothetical protein
MLKEFHSRDNLIKTARVVERDEKVKGDLEEKREER